MYVINHTSNENGGSNRLTTGGPRLSARIRSTALYSYSKLFATTMTTLIEPKLKLFNSDKDKDGVPRL